MPSPSLLGQGFAPTFAPLSVNAIFCGAKEEKHTELTPNIFYNDFFFFPDDEFSLQPSTLLHQ